MDSKQLTPSNKSSTLFVQLIDDSSNKSVWEEKYEIENGFVDGHLDLRDTLSAGFYILAGYIVGNEGKLGHSSFKFRVRK